jgi:selenide,water dikinase
MIGLDDAVRSEILFDPQTAGGFLAALAPDDARLALSALKSSGVAAVQIGTIEDASLHITLR